MKKKIKVIKSEIINHNILIDLASELQQHSDRVCEIRKKIKKEGNYIVGGKICAYNDEICIDDDLVAVTHNKEFDIPALCVQSGYKAALVEMYGWQGIIFKKEGA